MAYKEDLQKYYVGFYGRPADKDCLEYWNNVLMDEDGELGFDDKDGFEVRFAAISKFFAGVDPGGENSEYSMVLKRFEDEDGEVDNEGLVNWVYQNLFGREADFEAEDDANFWLEQLESGKSTITSIVHDVIGGIEAEWDKKVFENRLDFAVYFTENIEDKFWKRPWQRQRRRRMPGLRISRLSPSA